MCIDLLQPSVDLIVNQARINKAMPTFIPIGGGADQATAEIRQGLYRNIDRESNSAVARETAYQMAVSCGEGAYRVLIEDEYGLTFDKRIKIQRIDNLKCYAYDVTGIEFDGCDIEWACFWDEISQEEFAAQVPPGKQIESTGISLPEPERLPWFNNATHRVRKVEYFRKKWEMRTACQLSDGSMAWEEDVPKWDPNGLPDQVYAVAKLKKNVYTIEHYRMTGAQVIEKMEWKGRYIPLIVVKGREVIRGTKDNILQGMVGPAKDIVRAHNFAESRLIDEVALSPLPHMFAAAGTLTSEQELLINSINTHPWSVVKWKPGIGPDGAVLPKPEWVSFAPNIQAVAMAAVHAKDSLQRVLNTYAPQLGSLQADQSGKAIGKVQEQGDISHAAFPDNLARALLYEARVVNDLMDHVYTEQRVITITNLDDKTKQVVLNGKGPLPKGQDQHYLFGSGKYDVAMIVAPAYPSQQKESSAKLVEMTKFIPAIGQVAPDLVVEAIGVPGELGQRLQARLKPSGANDDSPIPPAVQQRMDQMAQMIDMQKNAINEMTENIKIKMAELDNKWKIALLQSETQKAIAANKTGSEEGMHELSVQIDREQAELDRSHEATLQREAPKPAATQ